MDNKQLTKWKPFIRAGGYCAFAYVVTSMLISGLMTLSIDQDIIGADAIVGEHLLRFIADHSLFWIVLQTLVLETSIFFIITLIALFLVLRDGKSGWALGGTVVGTTSQILFMGYYPMLMGLVFLADKFIQADPTHQRTLIAASEGLLATVNAFNPAYEALLAFGIVFVSAAMPGSRFRKWLSPFGYFTGGIAIAAIALFPVIGYWYLWWWGALVVWLTGVGIDLIRVART